MRMQPTLLNPGDSVTISILSSGGLPQFNPKARIVGVSSVPLKTVPKHEPSRLLTVSYFLVAILLVTLANAVYVRIDLFRTDQYFIELRRRSAIAISLLLLFIAIAFWMAFLDAVGADSLGISVLSAMALGILSFILAVRIEQPVFRKSSYSEKPSDPETSGKCGDRDDPNVP